MADVKTVDIDGSQWSMKDQEARNKITELEEKKWEFVGQGISSDVSQITLSVNIEGKKEFLFVYRTSSNATENLGSMIIPISEVLPNSMFRQTYISYVPSNAYLRFTLVAKHNNILDLSFTQSGVPNSVGALFMR